MAEADKARGGTLRTEPLAGVYLARRAGMRPNLTRYPARTLNAKANGVGHSAQTVAAYVAVAAPLGLVTQYQARGLLKALIGMGCMTLEEATAALAAVEFPQDPAAGVASC